MADERPMVVVGLARSGIAAATFLRRRGLAVIATDAKPADRLPAEALALADLGVCLEVGGHRVKSFRSASRVVVSPGVPWDLPELQAARDAAVPVEAEIELGFRHLRGRLAAVTGTKGKSTTTAALGAMLREDGGDVRVAGNIGNPLVGEVEASTDLTRFAVEVSSFQLEGATSFRPDVAVYLNLSSDHLDRHPSFEAYAAAKARIFAVQRPDDWAIAHRDDSAAWGAAEAGLARRVAFQPRKGAAAPAGDAAFFAAGDARLRLDGREERLFSLGDVTLPGDHLHGDLLAAAAAARLMGASGEAIERAAVAFRGAEHTLEHVATVDGIAFFNDSKATNVEAARKSIESFPGRVLLIAGGRYKGGDFAELGPPLEERGGIVLAMGESRPRLEAALAPFVPVLPCASLDEAVSRAAEIARSGDTVVLAPACSSFDMFRDYAERGRSFKAAVALLREARP